MTPRKRSISDADLLSAAASVAAERGIEHLRLADVAVATQLAPATLVQRFGSREGLLDALAARFIAGIGQAFQVSDNSRLAELALGLHGIAGQNHLPFFFARPASGAAYSLELRKHIGFSLVAAVEAGEIVRCDVAHFGRRLQLGYYGLITTSLLENAALELPQLQGLVEETLADYR